MRCLPPPPHPPPQSLPLEQCHFPRSVYAGLQATPSGFLHPTLWGLPWGLPGVAEPSEVKVVLFPGKAGLHPASQPSRVGR